MKNPFRNNKNGPAASIRVEGQEPEGLTLTIEGRLDSNTTAKLWHEATEAISKMSPSRILVDASKMDYCDVSGIGLLVEILRHKQRTGAEVEIRGLQERFQQLLHLFDTSKFGEEPGRKQRPGRLPEEVGRSVFRFWQDTHDLVVFVGELTFSLGLALRHPGRIRWKDAFLAGEATGVNALPIVALVSFLVGLIMAFQAVIPMRRFGAEIFVADLVGLAMVRELGPLMTAIVLTGRSGSAFAAELGTMKVNEEIDALNTMGLDPVRFLVVSRVLAALAMTPLLTVFADFIGVMGGSLVLRSLGYPFVTYFNQFASAVDQVDLVGGLVKSVVFGIMVAGIGCLRGLQTRTGPAAVGESATRAVVSGIILIVIVDGIFSAVYYYLGV
ncbi:MAG: MlaE family lipid ABC transporter permease subunit [Thermodesulfobacteriota bacterium]|nr:MlaE family lipid ABC transporter permease subunit [Thermodesulfobacteriota bacterium]